MFRITVASALLQGALVKSLPKPKGEIPTRKRRRHKPRKKR